MRPLLKALPRSIFALFTALIATLFVVRASAEPLDDGIAAYGRGDYVTALGIIRPRAFQGHAAAQNTWPHVRQGTWPAPEL